MGEDTEMRQATVDLFRASELSPKAQEKAREWYASLWDNCESDAITEMFQEMLQDAGLSDLEPRWSLSYGQGDGVAFYGHVDVVRLASKQPEIKVMFVAGKLLGHDLEEFQVEVVRIGRHYNHWNTMRTSVVAPDGLEDLGDELCKVLDSILVDLSRKMERAGYDEIDYRRSMECFLEAAEANEWEFTAEGELF